VLLLGAPMLLQLGRATASAVRRHWVASGRRFAAAFVWLLALAGLVAFSRFNLALSRDRSETVIEACRHYEKDEGQLPPTLEVLVPEYLPRVPRANWTALGSFDYQPGERQELAYFAPWPAQVVYSFDTGKRHVRENSKGVDPARSAPRVDASAGRKLRASVRPTDVSRPISRAASEASRATGIAGALFTPVQQKVPGPDLGCQGWPPTIVSNARRWRVANQVSHDHQCPECGGTGICFSPECRALPQRVCSRCMERAWQHSRRGTRNRRPEVPASPASRAA
jgi:hypothetical protein